VYPRLLETLLLTNRCAELERLISGQGDGLLVPLF
jgi:hypothetical protein